MVIFCARFAWFPEDKLVKLPDAGELEPTLVPLIVPPEENIELTVTAYGILTASAPDVPVGCDRVNVDVGFVPDPTIPVQRQVSAAAILPFQMLPVAFKVPEFEFAPEVAFVLVVADSVVLVVETLFTMPPLIPVNRTTVGKYLILPSLY